MTERITCEIDQGVATVWLNRPEKLNGLDMPMFQQMVAMAKRLRRDRSVRCVVLAAKGDSFCAGLDFNALSKDPKMVPKIFLKWPWRKQNLAQEIAHCWRDLPVPVICAIHGNCFGGGIQIALACDYRIATPDANLSIMEMKWGLIPDMSGMVTLSRLTRVDIAQELIMTGRQFSAEEGHEMGLISRLDTDPVAAAQAMARTVASKSPDAVAASKYLLKKTWQSGERGALLWERLVQMRLLGRKNQRIAMQNGLQRDKEPRRFLDRTSFR
ncbi:enoyl-CoA hydratase [Bacterioplanes sanyensis]|uniref:Enoyl-CoA hydratase n=1 Tax=Bacterioplanes sanyensis TaxID=1249553 RepID=A0A222FPN0_9GAMM|nr:crotonase/enoyl-CoA hydratase family protein [Bacterioplanes sanyensis]ASP40672.1 enoyl-CoA hydratase [Bacterioplanes sanyensis]